MRYPTREYQADYSRSTKEHITTDDNEKTIEAHHIRETLINLLTLSSACNEVSSTLISVTL
jgi:hypothetical protein